MTRPLSHLTLLLLLVCASLPAAAADSGMDSGLRKKARSAVDEGLHYLRGTQAEDGSWSGSVGITSLALRAYLESHRKYGEADGAFITRPIAYILEQIRPDGSISESNRNRNYNTAVALVALQATGNDAYRPVIERGQAFLAGLQIDEGDGYDPSHPYYGGIGYGGDERPDLSNAYMAIEALRTTALDPDSEVWDKALTFIQRCQNRSESNDQAWASNDGGFTYMPGYSPHGGTGSYGGMTHAGLISLLFAGVDRDDPRIQAAYAWIRTNYTLDRNPNASDNSGLYYYYTAFAKSLTAFGSSTIETTAGEERNWRNDFAAKMLDLQRDDGSWMNADSARWMEGNPELITAQIVVALNLALR